MNVRRFTNLVMQSMDEGILDPRTVADACLAYMSEVDVEDMAFSNEILTNFDEDEDEEEVQ